MEARSQKHNVLHMSMLNIHSLCKMKVQVFYFKFEAGAKKVGVANNYCHGVVVKSETKFCHKIHFCLP